ncbi:MAG: PAS domain S-box protein [Deltaproteobacteria bacterium]|nr:PAS domain S-box protein [Deltaproteobacteria bacterium]
MQKTTDTAALKRLENMLVLGASILDAIPQAVMGLRNRRIIFANNAVRDIFGWQPEELIGRHVSIIYRNARESQRLARLFYQKLAIQRTVEAEYPCRRKDGQDILCRLRAARTGETLVQRRIVVTYDDITEQKRVEEELRTSHQQLRDLSLHLQSLREKESTRIAREIHDELGQSLTALKMDVSWLGSQLSGEHRILREKTERMAALIDTIVDSVHRISTELRPILLDDLGLTAAMEWQAQEFQNRCGVECDIDMDFRESILEKDLATTLFRIFQEILTNVARHAGATHVGVHLTERGNRLRLEITDNGRGITPEQISDPKSFGIMGICERAGLWGGRVRITGKNGKGTTITVLIPLTSREV